MHKSRTGMKLIISVHWEVAIKEHRRTHHVLPESDFLALSRQCASILVADAFERWVTQVPGKKTLMTGRGFVRVCMGRERDLGRI